MKTKTIIYRFYLLLVCVIFCGCQNETSQEGLTPIDKIYPIVDKIQSVDGNDIREIRLYIIDSCEYIGLINVYHSSDLLTHKGNCKFCTERNKNNCY